MFGARLSPCRGVGKPSGTVVGNWLPLCQWLCAMVAVSWQLAENQLRAGKIWQNG